MFEILSNPVDQKQVGTFATNFSFCNASCCNSHNFCTAASLFCWYSSSRNATRAALCSLRRCTTSIHTDSCSSCKRLVKGESSKEHLMQWRNHGKQIQMEIIAHDSPTNVQYLKLASSSSCCWRYFSNSLCLSSIYFSRFARAAFCRCSWGGGRLVGGVGGLEISSIILSKITHNKT